MRMDNRTQESERQTRLLKDWKSHQPDSAYLCKHIFTYTSNKSWGIAKTVFTDPTSCELFDSGTLNRLKAV